MADIFRRNPEGKFERIRSNDLSTDVNDYENDQQLTCDAIILGEDIKKQLKNLLMLQGQDPYIKTIIDKIKGNQILDSFVIRENILFRRDAILNFCKLSFLVN